MRSSALARGFLIVASVGAGLACATGQALPPATEPAATAASPPPPALEPRTVSLPDADPRPPDLRLLDSARFTLNVQDADLGAFLLGLGRDGPIGIVVGPGVEGPVSADLRDVTLREILEEIVVPRGFQYAVAGNVLRVYRAERETRSWRVDYPSQVRVGSSNVSFEGFLGATASTPSTSSTSSSTSSQGTSSQDTSTATLATTQDLDFWGELERGLRTIVFGAPDAAPDLAAAPADGQVAASPPPRRVLVSRNTGLVTVTASSLLLDEVERFLAGVADATRRQVLIDVQVLEIDLGDDLDFGLDIEGAPDLGDTTTGVFARRIEPGDPAASLVQRLAPLLTEGGFSFGIARDELGLTLRAVAQQTEVRVISTPRITTLNNHKALIKVVRNEVFFVAEVENLITDFVVQQTTEFVPQIIPIGITLDVTPQISEDEDITLHIHPSVSEVVAVRPQPTSDPDLPQTGSLPVVDVRETDTVLRVKDGTTIVMGGLIRSREFESQRQVPLLGSLPALGWLFRRTEVEERRSELVIFLTPSVMDPPRIVRVAEDSRTALRAIDDLRGTRTSWPWWREPYGRSYGVAP